MQLSLPRIQLKQYFSALNATVPPPALKHVKNVNLSMFISHQTSLRLGKAHSIAMVKPIVLSLYRLPDLKIGPYKYWSELDSIYQILKYLDNK